MIRFTQYIMRTFFLYLGLLIGVNSFAQKGIDGLIQAEKNFAAYSVANGTKDAFLANMDSSSIVFDEYKPSSGIKVWTARKSSKAVLNWGPAYAEISVSNDFGYTTGPWTYRLPGTDSVIARGFFATLWHINKEGKWIFLVDLGVNKTPVANDKTTVQVAAAKTSVKTSDTADFIKVERDFIRLFNHDSSAAYSKYLSLNSLVNRNGYLPAVTAAEQKTLINSTSAAIQFTIDGWILSPGKDMACVYGSTMLNDKPDNYMRIWRHEKDGWKIALEILHH